VEKIRAAVTRSLVRSQRGEFHLLHTRVHLGEAEVAAMSKDQVIARMQQYWATGS